MRLSNLNLLLACGAITAVCPQTAFGTVLGFGYEVGFSVENTVVPGSVVSIDGILRNTSDVPLVFPPDLIGTDARPTVNAIGVNPDGDWSILSNGFTFGPVPTQEALVYNQFSSATIGVGEEFPFTIGTFYAPLTEPLGSSARPAVLVQLAFTDTIGGSVGAVLTYTLGTAPSASEPTFFEARVDESSPLTVPDRGTATELLGFSCFSLVAFHMAALRRSRRAKLIDGLPLA